MVSAKDCRDLVADCLRWAEMASHPDARRAFLAMAKTLSNSSYRKYPPPLQTRTIAWLCDGRAGAPGKR
jgi:hypothetical protein